MNSRTRLVITAKSDVHVEVVDAFVLEVVCGLWLNPEFDGFLGASRTWRPI